MKCGIANFEVVDKGILVIAMYHYYKFVIKFCVNYPSTPINASDCSLWKSYSSLYQNSQLHSGKERNMTLEAESSLLTKAQREEGVQFVVMRREPVENGWIQR